MEDTVNVDELDLEEAEKYRLLLVADIEDVQDQLSKKSRRGEGHVPDHEWREWSAWRRKAITARKHKLIGLRLVKERIKKLNIAKHDDIEHLKAHLKALPGRLAEYGPEVCKLAQRLVDDALKF